MLKQLIGVLALGAVLAGSQTGRLDVYFVDVEGGEATLIVTPSKRAVLIDGGWASFENRDARRVVAAARDAGVERLDYLIATHFHGDHIGAIPEIARRLPVATFVDNGKPLETTIDVVAPYVAYAAARAQAAHRVVKPGDRLFLDGVEIEVISSAGALAEAGSADRRPNSTCAGVEPGREAGGENHRSVGVRVSYGAFRFVDLGDLNRNPLVRLACPANLVGEADLFLLPHHGNGDGVVPAFLDAINARAIVSNNSATKGASSEGFAALHRLQGRSDVWQLHRSARRGVVNFADQMIANLEAGEAADGGHWIKASAGSDGSFTVTNSRNGFSKQYGAR